MISSSDVHLVLIQRLRVSLRCSFTSANMLKRLGQEMLRGDHCFPVCLVFFNSLIALQSSFISVSKQPPHHPSPLGAPTVRSSLLIYISAAAASFSCAAAAPCCALSSLLCVIWRRCPKCLCIHIRWEVNVRASEGPSH